MFTVKPVRMTVTAGMLKQWRSCECASGGGRAPAGRASDLGLRVYLFRPCVRAAFRPDVLEVEAPFVAAAASV